VAQFKQGKSNALGEGQLGGVDHEAMRDR
jgi:hypothetical protein